jgi:hypothetical protein
MLAGGFLEPCYLNLFTVWLPKKKPTHLDAAFWERDKTLNCQTPQFSNYGLAYMYVPILKPRSCHPRGTSTSFASVCRALSGQLSVFDRYAGHASESRRTRCWRERS